jgi:hypothetical protein
MGIIVSYIFIVGISIWILFGVLESFGILNPFLMICLMIFKIPQKLVGNIYSVLIEILLWLMPIGGFITFGIIFGNDFNNFHFGYAFIGLIGALFIDAIILGQIVIILNIRTSIKNIEKK